MNHIPSNERVICDFGFIYQLESWDDSMTQRLTLPVSCCRNPLRSYHTLSREGRCSPRCRVSEIDESPSKGSLPSTAQGDHLKKHLAELSYAIPSCLLIDLEVYHSWTRDALGGATLMQSEISRVALMVWSLHPKRPKVFWKQTSWSYVNCTSHPRLPPIPYTYTLSLRTFLTSKSPIFVRLHKKYVRFDLLCFEGSWCGFFPRFDWRTLGTEAFRSFVPLRRSRPPATSRRRAQPVGHEIHSKEPRKMSE